jgi:hypothetical protein
MFSRKTNVANRGTKILRSVIASSALRIACGTVLTFGAGALGTPAQTPRSDCPPAAPVDCHSLKQRGHIPEDTAAMLACEWLQPKTTGHVLNALELLTTSKNEPNPKAAADPKVLLKVLNELVNSDVDDTLPSWYRGVYRAALGDPDIDGRLRGVPLPNLLDTLAKANNLNSKEKGKSNDEQEQASHEQCLFKDTDGFVSGIYNDGDGPVTIAKIYQSFIKSTYFGFYELLKAGWDDKASPDDKQKYVKNLEEFRAAFELNGDKLVKQVVARNTPTTE